MLQVDWLMRRFLPNSVSSGSTDRQLDLSLQSPQPSHTASLITARLAGSGIGIGIQAKGTAVIHQADRLPHHNLELFSNAPITSLAHYRSFGANAATYAKGEMPEPVVVPTEGKAMGARYHAQVALIYAIETSLTADGAKPEDIEIAFLEAH